MTVSMQLLFSILNPNIYTIIRISGTIVGEGQPFIILI